MPQFAKDVLNRAGNGKRREDSKGKGVKVLDLLQYAIELGHLDALYKIAQISLVSWNTSAQCCRD